MELSFSLCLPRDEVSVPVVRRLCRSALDSLGVTDDCVQDISVAVTEACTNVLKHADVGEDSYEVEVKITEDECEITVTDSGSGFEHPGPGRGKHAIPVPHEAAESGRGLHLMSVLADDLRFTSRRDSGTEVRLVKALELEENAVLTEIESGPGSSDGRLRRAASDRILTSEQGELGAPG